ncbi:MAG: hypothetical protein CSA34_01480 [Desulfobulbus propionicus]|nr:MAG: hypothetical protein CSA34_01480 [Desulfobulbus propionicus]
MLFHFIRVTLLALVFSLVSSMQLVAAPFGKTQELVAKATTIYQSFMADPSMGWFRANVPYAKGILIVPQMLRGGFIVGGSGGSGVLLAQDFTTGRWSYPAFYSMGSVSLGFQIGAEASEIILMIMTEKGLDALLETEFTLGGDVTVAAGPMGGTAKAQTADILAFGRSKGAFGGISIEGALIKPRHDWNYRYYGRSVLPRQILIEQDAVNPESDQLRNLMPKPPVKQGKPLGT